MTSLDPNVLIDISTKIAAIDERTKSSEKQADHRHQNVMQAIQTFVPRKEIEQMDEATRDYARTLADAARQHCDSNREVVLLRVSGVESALGEIKSNSGKIKMALFTLAGGALLSLITYFWNILFVLKAATH